MYKRQILDTAAGEVSPSVFASHIAPQTNPLADAFPEKLGYYSKGITLDHVRDTVWNQPNWAGFGVDHRFSLEQLLTRSGRAGFLQGNFDQAMLFADPGTFKKLLDQWLNPLKDLSPDQRVGWVCGVGHGVLPKTPEANVRSFIETVRAEFQ